MKAEELMIGDWVSINESDDFQGYIGKVVITNADTNYVTVHIPNMHLHDVLCDDLQPIPLTPEILEKNGIKLFHTYTHPYRDGEWEDGELEEAMKHYPMYVYQTLSPNITFVIRPNELELKVYSSNYKTGVEKKEDVIFVHELQHALKLCGIEKEIVL